MMPTRWGAVWGQSMCLTNKLRDSIMTPQQRVIISWSLNCLQQIRYLMQWGRMSARNSLCSFSVGMSSRKSLWRLKMTSQWCSSLTSPRNICSLAGVMLQILSNLAFRAFSVIGCCSRASKNCWASKESKPILSIEIIINSFADIYRAKTSTSREHLHEQESHTDGPTGAQQYLEVEGLGRLGVLVGNLGRSLDLSLLLPVCQALLPLDLVERDNQVVNALHLDVVSRPECLEHRDFGDEDHQHPDFELLATHSECLQLKLGPVEVEVYIPIVEDQDVQELGLVVQEALLQLCLVSLQSLGEVLGQLGLYVARNLLDPSHLHPYLDVHEHQVPLLQSSAVRVLVAVNELDGMGKLPRADYLGLLFEIHGQPLEELSESKLGPNLEEGPAHQLAYLVVRLAEVKLLVNVDYQLIEVVCQDATHVLLQEVDLELREQVHLTLQAARCRHVQENSFLHCLLPGMYYKLPISGVIIAISLLNQYPPITCSHSQMATSLPITDLESGAFETETVMDLDSASDMSDDVKYLKLELNQLRRQNKYLRKRLEKMRVKYEADNKDKIKKQYAILKPEDPFAQVIKQLIVSKQILDAFGVKGRSTNFKIPSVEDIPKAYQSDTLAGKLEMLAQKDDAQKLNTLIDILQEQHNQRQEYTEELEEFLERVVDVIRRTTKIFTMRASKFRSEYQKLRSRVTMVRLQHQKYRMDINLMLRDMGGFISKKLVDPYSQGQSESLSTSSKLKLSSWSESELRKSARLSIQVHPKEADRLSPRKG